jgi:hypothetical protein
MMVAEPVELANSNLAQTYVSLGKGVEGTRYLDGPGYQACVGDVPHPICNFALSNNWTDDSVKRLTREADPVHPFNLYVLPSDRPLHLFLSWQSLGYVHTYSLSCMRLEPLLKPPSPELQKAVTAAEKDEISRFMATQFFGYQTAEIRSIIADATAEGEGLELFGLREGPDLIAAVMLHRTVGCVGLYNLCVKPERRKEGLGGSVVGWVSKLAAAENAFVTLQCDPKLERWYERLGFDRYGNLEVYSVAQFP